MKIYSNLNLFGNTLEDFTTKSMVVGTTNSKTTNGALKWVNGTDSEHPGHFEYYDLLATPNTGWTTLSTGTNQTINQYYTNGTFKLYSGTNASTNRNWAINVDPESGSPNASIVSFGASNGELIISNTGGHLSQSESFTLPLASQIIGSIAKWGTFTINNSGYTVPITVTIPHGLGTKHLIFSLYKIETVNSISDTLNSVMCDFYIKPTSPYELILTITSNDLTNVAGTYEFVVIGSSNETEITSNTITVTGTSV